MTKVIIPGNTTVTIPRQSSGQDAIQFEDEGSSLGTKGTVNEIDFVGSGVTASRNGNKITCTITSGSGAVSSVSGTANQISVSPTTGATVISLPSNVIFPGTWQIGTINYSDTGILFSAQSSTNSYNQAILQNTSNGANASTNWNVSNDQGTSTTNFGEFGINSSGFSGIGSLGVAGNVYLAAASTDLVIGTYSAKAIRFVVNMAATDALTISSNQNFSFNQLAQSSGWSPFVTFTPAANTAYTTATEFIDYDFKNRTVTWIDGTTATQRFTYFRGNTVNKTTTSAVFIDIFTAFFDPSVAGSGVTFTRNFALGVGGMIGLTGANSQILQTNGNPLTIGTVGGSNTILVTNNTTRFQIGSTGATTFINSPSTGGTWITFTQSGSSSGTTTGMLFTAGAHINQTTATEITDINFNLSAVMKMIDGTVTTQRAFRIQGRTYTPQTSALTLTEASTIEVTPSIAGSGTTITTNYAIKSTGNIGLIDANFIFGTTTGTKHGTSTSQKQSFWNATPIIQPTTAVATATRVGGGGTTVTDTDTFGGYKIGQIVQALQNEGLLA